eukprot:361248-Chlamydomonas_euryale.AAC.1
MAGKWQADGMHGILHHHARRGGVDGNTMRGLKGVAISVDGNAMRGLKGVAIRHAAGRVGDGDTRLQGGWAVSGTPACSAGGQCWGHPPAGSGGGVGDTRLQCGWAVSGTLACSAGGQCWGHPPAGSGGRCQGHPPAGHHCKADGTAALCCAALV